MGSNVKKEFPRGQLNPTILTTLIERDKYGYEIIEEIKEKTGIEVKQPSLYSSLRRMEGQQYISSYWQDSDIGGRRHYYCLTAIGKEFLEKNPVDESIFLAKKDAEEESIAINKVEVEKPEKTTTSTSENFKKTEPNALTEKNATEKFEEDLRKTVTDIEERVKKSLETESKPLFAQQDNIFNAITAEKPKEPVVLEEEKVEENFEQYALFEKSPEPEKINKIKDLHKKSANNPYQLRHISEEDLKDEFEKIRQQKSGVVSATENISLNKKDASGNVWLDRNSYMENQKKSDPLPSVDTQTPISPESFKEDYKPYKKKESENLDASISVRIARDNQTKEKNFDSHIDTAKTKSPALLNIESSNYASYLNAPATENQILIKKESYRYNYNKSIEKLENKFQEYASNKKSLYEPGTSFYKSEENAYERSQNSSPIFNSYKTLQAYFNSQGIGVSIYSKKNDSADKYISSSLIRFVRGITFSIISIILAFAFYFGIKTASYGKIVYIIIPILSIALTAFYGVRYYKYKPKILIKTEESGVSPVILPMVASCVILVIIGINLASGFKSTQTLQYFPTLVYPIILASYIAIITPLNKLIKYCILQLRERKINKNL